ncbi:hypothetical protein BDM02DRAFT_3123420 [Thelephora ganbajun]|uniref:Uncharacterized protein n=1 Tax=Thelephora ganbajun TaxID=370292 RepID=A0ACB6Z185_THEGA|nr:hypothetical protein BDM02DRAFT_3123420 [Thelephora ganbajun]
MRRASNQTGANRLSPVLRLCHFPSHSVGLYWEIKKGIRKPLSIQLYQVVDVPA